MTQNPPRDDRSMQRRLAAMERRLHALETAPRAAKTSFSNGVLIVGDPDSEDRIEINSGESRVRFNSAQGPTDLLAAGGPGGAMLNTDGPAGSVFPFATRALVWGGSYFTSLQVHRVNPDGSGTPQASIGANVDDSGGGHSYGQVSLSASGVGDPDASVIDLFSDGGIMVGSNGRTTDPPAPPAGSCVLYVKGTPARLYYRDPSGAVNGPL